MAASWYIMSTVLYWGGYRGLLSYLGGADVLVELHQLLRPPLQLGQTQLQPAPSAAQLRSLLQPTPLTAAATPGTRGRVMEDRGGQLNPCSSIMILIGPQKKAIPNALEFDHESGKISRYWMLPYNPMWPLKLDHWKWMKRLACGYHWQEKVCHQRGSNTEKGRTEIETQRELDRPKPFVNSHICAGALSSYDLFYTAMLPCSV